MCSTSTFYTSYVGLSASPIAIAMYTAAPPAATITLLIVSIVSVIPMAPSCYPMYFLPFCTAHTYPDGICSHMLDPDVTTLWQVTRVPDFKTAYV